MRARLAGRGEWHEVTPAWSDAGIAVDVGGEQRTTALVRHDNGEPSGERTLAALAAAGVELRCCASCAHFRFSGTTAQMSGDRAGFCGRVGFRSRTALVSIEHDCGEHEPVEGWPDRPDVAHRARLALADDRSRPARLDAFRGALLGLAVGDALGYPAEFRSRAQILDSFGPDGVRDFVATHDPAWRGGPFIASAGHPAGSVSDDTQMTLALARGLLEAGTEDLDTLMRAIGRQFVAWSRAPDNDRAPGRTCMSGCRRLADGVPWREAGDPRSKGCGSAMRVAPIGLLYAGDRQRLLAVARASSLLTHGHDAAIEGAAAAALLVSLALHKRTPQQMYDEVMEECAPRSPDLRACFERLPAMLEREPAHALSEAGLGEGWVAEQAVASALYCFWRTPTDYRATVLTAANTDGDSDSIACIAGGISGAFNGAGAIPAAWRTGVEGADELERLAALLADAAEPA